MSLPQRLPVMPSQGMGQGGMPVVDLSGNSVGANVSYGFSGHVQIAGILLALLLVGIFFVGRM